MSKIAVIVHSPEDRRVAAVARLRSIIGKSVAEIDKCIRLGEPMMAELLWLNDHEEVARRLRSIMSDLPALGASVHFFELEEDADPSAFSSSDEITPEVLLNMLDQWESD